MASTPTCRALGGVVEHGPVLVGPDSGTANVRISATGGRGTDERLRQDERRETTRRSTRRKDETRARQRPEAKPRRVTRRVPRVRMPSITTSYFGGGVTLARFSITGDTRGQILRSIRTRGPHGGAQGVTQPYLRYRFTFEQDRRGRCRIVRTGSRAVTMSFRVTLPRWSATSGTDRATASWWAAELRDTAAHERHHVRLWRDALRRANRIVATSSCRAVGRRLDAAWRKAIVANCRYDSAEYGVSMRACLRR